MFELLTKINKRGLQKKLIDLVRLDLQKMKNSAENTASGAVHLEAKSEGSKDTRATEQSYLARGQAKRVVELIANECSLRFMPLKAFASCDAISVGALVAYEDEEGNEKIVFFVTAAGGHSVLDRPSVRSVTAQSPLGVALLGKFVGDEFRLHSGKGVTYEIIAVS